MPKYTCIKKCFYRGRVWAAGETLQSSPEDAPIAAWFKASGEVQAPAPKPVEPKTFLEIQQQAVKPSVPAAEKSIFD